jgi:hypothetical protein
MKLARRLLVILTFAVAIAFPSTAFLCGTERWTVKVAQDEHIRFLYKNNDVDSGQLRPPVNTTIGQLSAYPWPFSGPSAYSGDCEQ